MIIVLYHKSAELVPVPVSSFIHDKHTFTSIVFICLLSQAASPIYNVIFYQYIWHNTHLTYAPYDVLITIVNIYYLKLEKRD